MKKGIVATAIGGALLSGALLGCGAANADAYYENCTAAWNAGVAPLHEGDDGYEAPRLDRDSDDIACESRNRRPAQLIQAADFYGYTRSRV